MLTRADTSRVIAAVDALGTERRLSARGVFQLCRIVTRVACDIGDQSRVAESCHVVDQLGTSATEGDAKRERQWRSCRQAGQPI